MRRAATAFLLLAALIACEREERDVRSLPPESQVHDEVALSPLSPGGQAPVAASSGRGRAFEENAYQISQGKHLYTWFNCTGCHGNGGGGSGPALMDDVWIYGGLIENIAATIRQGRPNGMPSFRGKIPEDQVWQIAAYVRSMGRNVPKSAAPGRSDHLYPGSTEQQRTPGEIRSGAAPP